LVKSQSLLVLKQNFYQIAIARMVYMYGGGGLSWKRRPSEIRGYERAMYATLGNGDYIRVDYNLTEGRVRLFVEVSEEKNSSYYAVISGGKIITERNNSGRTIGVAKVISDRADEFSTLPNKEVLRLINKNYGIIPGEESEKIAKEEEKKKQRRVVKQRYFKDENDNLESPYYSDSATVTSKRRINFLDLLDFFVGVSLGGLSFFMSQYNFFVLGACLVFWGILLGILDIFIREREPVFIKILLFLVSGTAIYLYEYFI